MGKTNKPLNRNDKCLAIILLRQTKTESRIINQPRPETRKLCKKYESFVSPHTSLNLDFHHFFILLVYLEAEIPFLYIRSHNIEWMYMIEGNPDIFVIIVRLIYERFYHFDKYVWYGNYPLLVKVRNVQVCLTSFKNVCTYVCSLLAMIGCGQLIKIWWFWSSL